MCSTGHMLTAFADGDRLQAAHRSDFHVQVYFAQCALTAERVLIMHADVCAECGAAMRAK